MKYVSINRKEKDLAGKFRVWVNIEDHRIIMLKFSTDPDETMIEAECNRIDALISKSDPKQEALKDIDDQIARLTEKKAKIEAAPAGRVLHGTY